MNKCIRCGKCCQTTFFLIDSYETENGKDHLYWAEHHNLKIEFCKLNGKQYWGIRLNTPCIHLKKCDEEYVCAFYSFRPKMCINYTGKDEFPECGYNR